MSSLVQNILCNQENGGMSGLVSMPDYLGSSSASASEASSSTSSPLPRFRRSTSRLSSSTYHDMPQVVQIKGEATLCFVDNGASFIGVINSDDTSYYSISGRRASTKLKDDRSCGCDSSSESSDDEETVVETYDIKVNDHEDYSHHFLRGVHAKQTSKECKFRCPNISFDTDQIHRGSKAQLVARSCLGDLTSADDLIVYSGKIHITVLEQKPKPRHWVL